MVRASQFGDHCFKGLSVQMIVTYISAVEISVVLQTVGESRLRCGRTMVGSWLAYNVVSIAMPNTMGMAGVQLSYVMPSRCARHQAPIGSGRALHVPSTHSTHDSISYIETSGQYNLV
jgi:hypothetical protein